MIYIVLIKLNRTKAVAALSELPQDAVKTITRDRGSEFAHWRETEKMLHCDVFRRSVLCMIKGNKWELKRTASGILSQEEKSFSCFRKNTQKIRH